MSMFGDILSTKFRETATGKIVTGAVVLGAILRDGRCTLSTALDHFEGAYERLGYERLDDKAHTPA